MYELWCNHRVGYTCPHLLLDIINRGLNIKWFDPKKNMPCICGVDKGFIENVISKTYKTNRVISKNYKISYPPSKRFLDKISRLHNGNRTMFTWYMWRSIDPTDVEY